MTAPPIADCMGLEITGQREYALMRELDAAENRLISLFMDKKPLQSQSLWCAKAHRKNSQKSTGPRTARGKADSRTNAAYSPSRRRILDCRYASD